MKQTLTSRGGRALPRKLKIEVCVSLFALAFITLLGYQNCGKFAADPLLSGLTNSSSGTSGADLGGVGTGADFDSPYTDGLSAGTSQMGALFARDPSSGANDTRLSFQSDLTPYTRQTTIKHLDSSKAYLSDGYADFHTDDFYSSYASPTSSLVFAPTDSRFQQVNAYFHIDRLIADLSGQSLFPTSYPALKVNAHCRESNNAYYDTTDHLLCLGYSSVNGTKIWAADDTDVITHEFGHSLNHRYSTTEILSSSPEMGAMDEGFADLWAYRNSSDPRVSLWFGRAIQSPSGSGAFTGLRNLDAVKNYPSAVVDEIHADSVFISAVVKDLESKGAMSSTALAKFEKHLLESLQFNHGFSDVIQILQDEAPNYGVTTGTVNSALVARGLYRKDLASEVILDQMKPVYVIDNHSDTNLANGNCNGALDAGETALLFPNVRNLGSNSKGGISMTLVSNTSGVTVLSGGDYGYLYRIPASTTYTAAELDAYSPKSADSSTDYGQRLIEGAFYVKVGAGVSGTASFSLNLKTMNTIDSLVQTVSLPITLNVGSAPNQTSNCGTSAEASVFP